MKLISKISVVVLSLCLVLGALASAVVAAEPNVNVVSYQTQVEVGDEIVIEIKNNAMSIRALSVFLDFDGDLVWLSEMVNDAGEDAENNMQLYKLNSRGKKTKVPMFMGSDYDRIDETSQFSVLFMPGEDTDILAGTIVTLYFEATASGVAEFVLTQESTGNNVYNGESSVSVTIKDANSCNHPTTKLVPNEDSTHNVVCADEACGAIVEENVACTVDDTKTTEYTEYDANCCEPGSKFVTRYCACGVVLADKSGSEIIPATGEHTIVKHDELAATCTTPGRKAYWMCDQTCLSFTDADGKNKIEDFSAWMSEGGEGYLPVDPNNHTGNNTTKYVHIDGTWTHTITVTCENCTKPISSSTGDCVDNDGDKCCDYCGYFPLCKHDGEKDYLSTDSTNHDIYCSICNAKIGEGAHSIDESKTVEYILKPADCCFTGMKQVIKNCVCGHEMSNDTDVEIPATGKHTLVKHDELAATCINPGIQEYWECESSSCKYTDADGKNKIEDFSAWLSEDGEGYLPADRANHTSSEVIYTNNGETHSAIHACCRAEYVTNEPHDYTYDAENHKCICDAVETFTLTVMDMEAAYSGKYPPANKIFTVPYGTNILDYIKEQIDLGNVDMSNQTVNDETQIGTYIFDGYWRNISAGWGSVEEDSIVSGDTRITVGADFTGWIRVSENSIWGYQDGGHNVVGWYEIDGNWYYFFKTEESDYSFRAEGLTRVPYPTVKVDGNTYAPKAEDLAYNPNFKDATEAWFLFDANGVFQSTETGMAVNVNGDSCYMVNGMIPWHLGFVNVENVGYMYFAGDADLGGNKPVTGFVRAIRDYNTGKPVGSNCIYYFDISALAMYEGVEEVAGKLYYFDSDNKLALGAGIVRTVGGYVFVRSSGELALNDYWVTVAKANGYLEGDKLYNFGEDGYLTINPSRNGIIDGVYYKEGVPFYAGLIEIEGDIYYVKSNGEVVTGTYYVTKTNGMDGFKRGDKLVFGEDGKMEEVKNGVIDGYYYENNHIKYGAGLIKLGDDVYYVRSNGQVATGWYFITTTNDMPGFKKGEKYCFGEDGKLINE